MHINHINEGSYVPPSAPTMPATKRGSSRLSGEAIACIVVGVVAGIALVGGFFGSDGERDGRKGEGQRWSRLHKLENPLLWGRQRQV